MPALRARRHATSALIVGQPFARRLALTHAIDDFADALVNLSLVDSLFLSVSLNTSRERILMYLVLTAAPLAIVAPALGNLLDRSRVGYGRVLAASQLVRAAASIALVGSLLTVALYPLTFLVLLSRKVYAVSKSTLLSRMAPDSDALVQADAHISRTGTLAGGIGTGAAGLLLATTDAQLMLVCAAVVYVVAAIVSRRLRQPETPLQLRSVEPLAQMIPRRLWNATMAVTALRATGGALTYLLAFAIKRGGGQAWIFAAGLLAAGAGRMLANLAAGPIHRSIHPDWILVLALLVPGTVCALGVATVGHFGVLAIAFFIGLGQGVGTRAITMMNAAVPELARGRTIARSELLFQLASLVGAILAVQFAVTPTPGFAAASIVLVATGTGYAIQRRHSLRLHASRMLLGDDAPAVDRTLPEALLLEAQRLALLGAYRMAVVVASCAVDVLVEREPTIAGTDPHHAWLARQDEVTNVRAVDEQPTEGAVLAVLASARTLVDGVGTRAAPWTGGSTLI